MTEVRKNQPSVNIVYVRLFTTLSNSTRLSAMRFWEGSSNSIWSYSLSATQKMIDVTDSNEWIHLDRSERCPPRSTRLMRISPIWKLVSTMPVVLERECSTSSCDGT